MASPILKIFFPNIGPVNEHRNHALFQFENLEKLASVDEPKFVFAHILLPHEPYVFGKDCEFLSREEVRNKTDQENYLNQLACTNKKIKHFVNQLLKKSKNPPVIILQADEGPHPIKYKLGGFGTWGKANKNTLQEKFRILNAYYLPKIDKKILNSSITPVNTFRVIFNAYFNDDNKLLPNENYVFQDLNHLYKFINVSDKVR